MGSTRRATGRSSGSKWPTLRARPPTTWFNDEGKTKNGHAVVLKLEYRGVKILLGGDLNTPAEEYLLRHYTGLDPRPETPEGE